MSAYGPKRTSLVALHMSAFGGKADMTFCGFFYFLICASADQPSEFGQGFSDIYPRFPAYEMNGCMFFKWVQIRDAINVHVDLSLIGISQAFPCCHFQPLSLRLTS
jgi:hypothetical protein